METDELKEFIHFFTRSKRLSKAQQAKRDLLLGIDYLFTKDSGKIQVKPDLSATESNYGIDKNHLLEMDAIQVEKKLKDETIRTHNPEGVKAFLSLFSKDDTLKWYTHKWDKQEPFLIEDFINNSYFNQKKIRRFCFGENNYGVPSPLYYHIWNFINLKSNDKTNISSKDQFGNEFKTKWVDVKEWCESNPGLWPGDYITPQGVSFESEINRFKRTIEFRTDVEPGQKFGFQIKSLIRKSINGAVKLDFSERFDQLGRGLKFYCNVNAVHIGISKLCDWVASYKAVGDTLSVDLNVLENNLILTLLHKGSVMSGPDNKIDGLSGDFKTIREILFSTCDFEMSGEFNGKNVKITALDKESQTKGGLIITPTAITSNPTKANGVCYTLKFYM